MRTFLVSLLVVALVAASANGYVKKVGKRGLLSGYEHSDSVEVSPSVGHLGGAASSAGYLPPLSSASVSQKHYAAPSLPVHAPAPTYGVPALAPAPSFHAPVSAPASTYGVPASAPAPSFHAPVSAPALSHGVSVAAPAPSFSAPLSVPAPSYGVPASAPALSHSAPISASVSSHSVVSVPAPSYGAPVSAPAPSFHAHAPVPAPSFSAHVAAPAPVYGVPSHAPAPVYSAPVAASSISLGASHPVSSGYNHGLNLGSVAVAPSSSYGAPSAIVEAAPSVSLNAGSFPSKSYGVPSGLSLGHGHSDGLSLSKSYGVPSASVSLGDHAGHFSAGSSGLESSVVGLDVPSDVGHSEHNGYDYPVPAKKFNF